MLHGPAAPGVAGSDLTRLLAALPDASVASPIRTPLPERLGDWLGWTGAIDLSAALAAPSHGATVTASTSLDAEAAHLARVDAGLRAAIDAGRSGHPADPHDFAADRRRCMALQQSMEDAAAVARDRVRRAMVRAVPALGRLAAIDAVMADALAARERALLAQVPLRLRARFDRLREQADRQPRWHDIFEHDLRHVLRAELDHRLAPARALLAAWRERTAP